MVTGTIPTMWTKDVDKYFRELEQRKVAEIVPAMQSQFCMTLLSKLLAVDPRVRPTSG